MFRPAEIDSQIRVSGVSGSQPVGSSAYIARIEVVSDTTQVAGEWLEFERTAIGTCQHHLNLVQAWVQSKDTVEKLKLVIVIGRDQSGRIRFLLPFQLNSWFGLRILRWFNDKQGTYFSGLFEAQFIKQLTPTSSRVLWSQICDALPRVDVLHLTDQPLKLGEFSNPFRNLGTAMPGEPGHFFTVSGDWSAHFKSRFGKNSRKKLRQFERRLNERGGLTYCTPRSESEKLFVLKTLIRIKRDYYSQIGVPDHLRNPADREAYGRMLVTPSPSGSPEAIIRCLKVGDEIVAATFGFKFGSTYYGLLLATTCGPLRRYTPGKIHLKFLVDELASSGIQCIDFGIGADINKERWCDKKRQIFHSLIPITAKGHTYALAQQTYLLSKSRMKRLQCLWNLAKKTAVPSVFC